MRRLLAVVVLTAFTAGFAGAWLYTQARAPQTIQIQLSSSPFPLVVGPNTLAVQVTDASGTPVENATVSVEATLAMGGQLPMHGTASQAVDGWYDIPITIPMRSHCGRSQLASLRTVPPKSADFWAWTNRPCCCGR